VESTDVIVVVVGETERIHTRRVCLVQLLFEFRTRVENDGTLVGFDEQVRSPSTRALCTISTPTELCWNANGLPRTE
jgi:hypothetical protein